VSLKKISFILVVLLGAGGPAELREVACDQPNKLFYFILFYFILFYFLSSAPWGLALRTSAGLSHGSPPFDFEVAFCPPPTS
jgi:hypothetical protein